MTRELRPVLRDPFSLIFGMIQPLVFLALFGPLLVGSLGGQADGALGGSVWQWFVPAILVMTALFGTSTTGANLLFEFQTGAHERMLVTPLSPAVAADRAVAEGDGAARRAGGDHRRGDDPVRLRAATRRAR